MRSPLLLAFCLLIFASSGHANDKGKAYTGADAGCVIYAVGTIDGFGMRFGFPYRRIAMPDGTPTKDWAGEIRPKVGGAIYLKIKDPDFTGKETGHVVVRCLPPGMYEIDKFQFFGSIPGLASYRWKPAKPFSMPFSIKSGEATYIGSFMRGLPLPGMVQEDPQMRGGIFVVANRSNRDIEIANGKIPSGMKVVQQVTDVSQFGIRPLMADLP